MLALRLDDGDDLKPREEHVVRPPFVSVGERRPLGDREVSSFGRAHAALVRRAPSRPPSPLRGAAVDELARRRLVEIDGRARLGRLLDRERELLRRHRLRGGLERGELGEELLVLLLERADLLARERLPDRGVLFGLRGPFLRGEPLGGLFLRGLARFFDRARRGFELLLSRRDVVAKALQLVVEASLRRLRIRGRNERTRIEFLVVAEAALEPNRELARHAELMKRFAVVALSLVDGGVADAAQIVKERALRRADDVPLEEPVDELLLPFLRTDEERDLRCRALREDFAELTQLEERDRGIVPEVLLGLRGERHESRVVIREVGEVRRGGRVHAGRIHE